MLSNVFGQWMLVHHDQKKQWAQVVRFRFQLQRLKLKRILSAFRIQTRLEKITRLRTTILSHQKFKRTRKQCLDAWKDFIVMRRNYKKGLLNLTHAVNLTKKRGCLAFLQFRNQRVNFLLQKEHQIKCTRIVIRKQWERKVKRELWDKMERKWSM